MKTKLNILIILAMAASSLAGAVASPQYVASAAVEQVGTITFTSASAKLTAVDPLAWGISADVLP